MKLLKRFKPDEECVPMTPHYIKLPHMKATLVAVQALLEDGAGFKVVASGPTGSITVTDTRSESILRQVDKYYRRPHWSLRVYHRPR